jgi:hypothetical protein
MGLTVSSVPRLGSQGDTIETEPALCYMVHMTFGSPDFRPSRSVQGLAAHSTLAFAAIGDHARLPARFFARLQASDRTLLRS